MGAAVGGELNTVLLILNTKEALDVFANSTQVTLGGNLGIALGPIGRNIEGAGAVGVGSGGEALAPCYAYSVSRGLYAGVTLDGTVVFTRDRLNHTFYGHPASAKQLLSGKITPPRAADCVVSVAVWAGAGPLARRYGHSRHPRCETALRAHWWRLSAGQLRRRGPARGWRTTGGEQA